MISKSLKIKTIIIIDLTPVKNPLGNKIHKNHQFQFKIHEMSGISN